MAIYSPTTPVIITQRQANLQGLEVAASSSNIINSENQIKVLRTVDQTVEYTNTIALAFATASSGDTVSVGLGPYAEGNLTLPDGVHFQSVAGTAITGDGTMLAPTLNLMEMSRLLLPT
jgi:hypothetical protein